MNLTCGYLLALTATFMLQQVTQATKKVRTPHPAVLSHMMGRSEGQHVKDIVVGEDDVEHNVKRRFRRMLGKQQKCIPVLKHFCKLFTRKNIRKKFCLSVPVNTCWALD